MHSGKIRTTQELTSIFENENVWINQKLDRRPEAFHTKQLHGLNVISVPLFTMKVTVKITLSCLSEEQTSNILLEN